MSTQNSHLHDEDLLLHASGEPDLVFPPQLRLHLDSCPHCRERLRQLQHSLSQFSEAHRNLRHAEIPPAQRSRLALQSRIAESMARKVPGSGHPFLPSFRSNRTFALAGLAIAACLALAIWLRRPPASRPAILASTAYSEEPDLRLTPGATIPVTQNDICGSSEASPSIPVSLKRKVFLLYKVTEPSDQFEVDYLITPELGGATDIRNLWPEPYHDALWNAHVKDQLEDRLHRMVCHGDLDLATAQRDISTDWIAAYRKYFHTDRPISDGSASIFSSLPEPLPRT